MAFDEQRLANRVNLANQSIKEKYHAGMLSFEQEAAVEELAKRGRIDLSPPQRNPLSASTLDISHGNPFYSVSELDKLRAQHQKEQEWEQQYGAKIEGLEQPWIDPVEALAGGLTAIPKGLAVAGSEMMIDPLVGFGMERMFEDGPSATPAMFIGKRGLKKLGGTPDVDGVKLYRGGGSEFINTVNGDPYFFTSKTPARLYGKVSEHKVDIKNPHVIDAGGRLKGDFGDFDGLIDEAKEAGNDALIVKNVIDVPMDIEEGYYRDRLQKYMGDVVIPFNYRPK